MNLMNIDTFYSIITQSELEDVSNLCKSSKEFSYFCKSQKISIAKHFIKKYNINFNNPNNLIYFGLQKKQFEEIKVDPLKILKLYLKYYNREQLTIYGIEIDEIPILPKLIELYCNDNEIKKISNFPNLKILYCERNQITSISNLPKLIELYCDDNQITSMLNLPKLIELNCANNQITSIENLPNLNILYCDNNQITSMSNLPKLRILVCENNKFIRIENFPKLTFLRCGNNEITRIENLPKLEMLYAQNNPRIILKLSNYKNKFINTYRNNKPVKLIKK